MTPQQRKWLDDNPSFSLVGPPRPVKFKQWGTLTAMGEYERLDDKPRQPIQVGAGNIGVGEVDATV